MSLRNIGAAAALALLPLLTGCSRDEAPTTTAKEEAAPKAEQPAPGAPAAAEGHGTIAGRIVFKGSHTQGKLPVGRDREVCGDSKLDPSLIVAGDAGVRNAVIQISGLRDGREPVKEAELDQVKCEYVPHVLVVSSGATVTIKNSDGILHNVHTVSKDNPPFNKAQPKFMKEFKETFAKPEIISVRCDVHAWMSGWIVVTDNVFFDISKEDGSFNLAGVPQGKYTLEVWHEKLGRATQEVEVKAGETVNVNYEMGLQT
jgi:plastocyanin